MDWPPFDWLAGDADVYHFPNFIRPPLTAGKKSVVTIHDVSFLRMPETTEAKNLAWLTGKIRQTARMADAILTDSYFSAQEICELLDVPSEKVFPVWLGLPDFGEPPAAEAAAEIRRALGLERPYLLMVGTIEPRKNIPFLVKIFEELRDFDGDLVLAGGLGWKVGPILQAVFDSPRRERIKLLKRTSDAQLAALYAGATAFVFPRAMRVWFSPPLESDARTRRLLRRRSSLPEVLGNTVEWVELRCGGVANRCARFSGIPARGALRMAGQQRARLFCWRDRAASLGGVSSGCAS